MTNAYSNYTPNELSRLTCNGITFLIGDKVKIKEHIIGVTAIDRGKEYTILTMYDKRPCSIFPNTYELKKCLNFVELPNNYFDAEYFIVTERHIKTTLLDEDLFVF